MKQCVFCKRMFKKGSNVSFHKFPTDSKCKSQWLQNMKAINWTPKQEDSLCSEHFDVKCLKRHNNRTSLKLGSVPTIFEGSFKRSGLSEQPKTADGDNASGRIEITVEPQQAAFTDPYKHGSGFSEKLETTEGDNVFERIEIKVEPELAALTNPYGSGFSEELETADGDNVSDRIEIKVEPDLAAFTHQHKHDVPVSVTFENMGTSSSSWCQSPNQSRVKTESMFEDNRFQKDASTSTDDLETVLQDNISDIHNYDGPKPPKISSVGYGVYHDHQYEISHKSLKQTVERTKQSLKLAHAKVKALQGHVKRLKAVVRQLSGADISLTSELE